MGAITMGALIIAGEAIFGLPFHVARFFRPSVLDVFRFTNTELGAVMAAYGVIAMLSYFPGGVLADRFSARRLMTASLLATGAGGFFFASGPSSDGLMMLFGFWGATSILLFWAALIRATREWGGEDEQGRAFGLLDGGRGLLAAITGSAAVALFAAFLPDDPSLATLDERAAALIGVIHVYTALTFAAAIVVWFAIPDSDVTPPELIAPAGDKAEIKEGVALRHHVVAVLRMPAIWLQATIVVCAYVAFKGLDNYSLLAVQVFGMDEVTAAQVTAIGAWVRPFAALGAGLLADRLRPSVVSLLFFAALIATYSAFAFLDLGPSVVWLLWLNVIVVCVAIFGLRGVYFALFEEASVPPAYTGTATGVVSVIGYTPDIFVAPIAGMLLDRSPGLVGHQHVFMLLGVFAILGLIASALFHARPSGPKGPKGVR